MNEEMKNVTPEETTYIPMMVTLIGGDDHNAPEDRRVMGHMANVTHNQLINNIDPIVKMLQNELNRCVEENIKREEAKLNDRSE